MAFNTAAGYNIAPATGQLTRLPQVFPITAPVFTSFVSDGKQRIFLSDNGPTQCHLSDCSYDTKVSSMLRNSSTGDLMPGMDNVVIPVQLTSFTAGPSGKFLYAVQAVEDDIYFVPAFFIRAFRIDYQSGAITQQSIPDVPVGASDVLFTHPTLPVLYVLKFPCCILAPTARLHVYSVNEQSGALAEMPQSPMQLSGGNWQDPAISVDGAYLYAHASLTADPRLAVFRLDQNGMPQSAPLAVIALPPFPRTQNYSVHPNGKFVYGWGLRPDPANPGRQLTELHVYRLDEAAAGFSQEDISSALPGLLSTVTFDTAGRHFYMRADPNGPGSLQLFDVDQTSGELTFVGPQP